MSGIGRALWRTGNRVSVWLYRRTGGNVAGKAQGGTPGPILTVDSRLARGACPGAAVSRGVLQCLQSHSVFEPSYRERRKLREHHKHERQSQAHSVRLPLLARIDFFPDRFSSRDKLRSQFLHHS